MLINYGPSWLVDGGNRVIDFKWQFRTTFIVSEWQSVGPGVLQRFTLLRNALIVLLNRIGIILDKRD